VHHRFVTDAALEVLISLCKASMIVTDTFPWLKWNTYQCALQSLAVFASPAVNAIILRRVHTRLLRFRHVCMRALVQRQRAHVVASERFLWMCLYTDLDEDLFRMVILCL